MSCPYCGKGMEGKGEYKEMSDDSSIKDSVLADLMETMSKGMGSKLKKPMAISIEIEKMPSKMSKMTEEEED
jgi:hypothetical protein